MGEVIDATTRFLQWKVERIAGLVIDREYEFNFDLAVWNEIDEDEHELFEAPEEYKLALNEICRLREIISENLPEKVDWE